MLWNLHFNVSLKFTEKILSLYNGGSMSHGVWACIPGLPNRCASHKSGDPAVSSDSESVTKWDVIVNGRLKEGFPSCTLKE